MIEKIFISSFLTFAVWYSLQENQIFGAFGNWLKRVVPEPLQNPIFDCPICMGFWYSSIFYALVYRGNVTEWLVVAISTVGLNYFFMQLVKDEEDNDDEDEDEDEFPIITSPDRTGVSYWGGKKDEDILEEQRKSLYAKSEFN